MAYLPATPAPELVEGTTVVGMTYIPTIETTVVTTTKTTTTTLPQVIIKPQVPLSELDGKTYPLASSVTPASLRSFVFDVNGTPTLFQESSDPSNAWRDVSYQR